MIFFAVVIFRMFGSGPADMRGNNSGNIFTFLKSDNITAANGVKS